MNPHGTWLHQIKLIKVFAIDYTAKDSQDSQLNDPKWGKMTVTMVTNGPGHPFYAPIKIIIQQANHTTEC